MQKRGELKHEQRGCINPTFSAGFQTFCFFSLFLQLRNFSPFEFLSALQYNVNQRFFTAEGEYFAMTQIRLTDYKGKQIHFIGIGGSSMSGLAELLVGAGYRVRGDDRAESHSTVKLKEEGIEVIIGHDPKNVHGADLVIYTAAIPEDNPERQECVRLGIPQMVRADLLGQLSCGYKDSVSVCGTHGKTTTTAMLSTVLMDADCDPTIHIGGEIDRIGGSVHAGHGSAFVTEACEFQASFLTLHPTLAIVLNIDADHLDFYKDITDIENTFAKFLNQIAPGGTAVLCGDNARALSMKDRISANVLTYGLSDSAFDCTAKDVLPDSAMNFSFTPVYKGEELPRVTLKVPGRHNVGNALAVICACKLLGVEDDKIVSGLNNFAGAHRRFELTATVDGVKLYHDYGHNPAEFTTVVPLGKAVAGKDHKLFVVCQPHTYSRTKALFNDYLTCFDGADEVLVTDIFAAREKDPGDIHATMLVKAMLEKGIPAVYTPDFDACEAYLRANWHEGDVMLSLGCGNINQLNDQLAK